MGKRVRALAVFLLGMALVGCSQSPPEPITLRYSYAWLEDTPQIRSRLQQFTQETGIRVKAIPIADASREYVEIARKVLSDSSGPDVLNIDLIWSPLLEPNLIDLRPYLTPEISQLEPQLLASYTVNGKLVAVPFNATMGILEYRSDLLREYGYDHAPRTWTELETMADRIQQGERAKGNKDFWGYVWQGSVSEGLMCNALEWQASAGGGRIIEPDGTISVNNPAAIRTWQRARHWIGWISPPSVLAYTDVDSMLVFDAGRAAFSRVWFLTPITRNAHRGQRGWRSVRPPVVETGFSRMPGGVAGSVATLGGAGTGVSMHSTHRQEAIALVRFQLHALMQVGEHDGPALVEFPDALTAAPDASSTGSSQTASLVARPSVVAGDKYEQASKVYIDAVHSVLAGQTGAAEAAAELEKQLVTIIGFRTARPTTADKTAERDP